MEPKQTEEKYDGDRKTDERGSWLDVAMATVNNHLQLFRTLPWVMGGVGALLIAKYSGMFTRYRKSSDIPSHLISQGATLRGVAVGVWPDGRLDIWHTPIGRRWLRWNHTPPNPPPTDQTLAVRLAALQFRQPQRACAWIRSNLIGRPLHLQLIHLPTIDQSLRCIISYRMGYSRRLKCANIELLSLGLASLEEEPSLGRLGNNSNGCRGNERLIAFLGRSVRAESGAQRGGVGMWRGSVHESKWRKALRFLRLRR